MSEFVHLHCHTEYSLLDGAIKIKDLCARAKDYGMESVAITDHGNLFGAIDFYTQARSFGLKPIIGCEVYVAHGSRFDRESAHARTRYHLILLAQNKTGYRNLLKLVTAGFTEGYYYKPRVDKEILAAHSEGIIALSACLAGEIPRILMTDQNIHRNAEDFGDGSPDRGGMDAALEMAEIYSKIFPGRFYLELQENGLEEQRILNARLLELAEKTGLPIVATNDCHYLDKADVDAHDILLCIQTQNTINDERRMRFETRELYYKTPEEMESAFAHVPQALDNSLLIAEQCNVELDLKSYHFPTYAVDSGKSLDEELCAISRAGLEERIENSAHRDEIDREAYRKRLELELEVICKMGFSGYFLIVQDFINWAKKQKIPVGPGRGSAAGSLVAWSLRITDLDPIPYNLLFERFLNPERVSMPDIDVDFCERRRTEVIDYVARKYGADSVAQITTFGKMKAKAVVRDVARALGMSYADGDKIAKLIPEELKMTIRKAMEQEPELSALYNTDDTIRRLLDTSIRLEGLNRHASTHAAGVVISDRPMVEYLPLYKGKGDEIVTQFDMKMVEKIGLIKFDFLGLRTMTLIQDTLDLITAGGREAPDLSTLPLNDPAVYELYSRGDTYGIFQVE
ncbi:MAG: DNA polymerase III subunit alpha, partial [Desulfovibrionaceae bacterium]|nr:DNA polymerase III subunit alpha [Desulfovibrionaceae bacterium]